MGVYFGKGRGRGLAGAFRKQHQGMRWGHRLRPSPRRTRDSAPPRTPVSICENENRKRPRERWPPLLAAEGPGLRQGALSLTCSQLAGQVAAYTLGHAPPPGSSVDGGARAPEWAPASPGGEPCPAEAGTLLRPSAPVPPASGVCRRRPPRARTRGTHPACLSQKVQRDIPFWPREARKEKGAV